MTKHARVDHGNHFDYFYRVANKGTQPGNGKKFHLKNIPRESLIVVLVNTAIKKKLSEVRFSMCTPTLIKHVTVGGNDAEG